MTNITLTLDDKEVTKLMSALVAKITDASSAMTEVAQEMSLSISRNFQAGGRYSSPNEVIGGEKKWKPLSKTTEKIKARQGKKGPYQILVDSAQLASSISTKHGKNFAEVGTNKSYAAAQHFGRPAGEALIKAHIRHIKEQGRAVLKGGKLGKEKTLKRQVSVRAHMRKTAPIPARPFMTIHPDSIEAIKDTLLKYLTRD
jgi:phage gpG-like protein